MNAVPVFQILKKRRFQMFRIRSVFLFFTVLLFIVLGVNGCSTKSPPEPGRYYNKNKGFSIKFPDDWVTGEGYKGTTVIALSPPEDSNDQFHEYVSVVVEEGYMSSLEVYFKGNIENLKKLMKDYRFYEEGQMTINQNDVRWIVYSCTPETYNLKIIAYVLFKNSRGYIVSCVASPDKFSQFKDQFKEIAKTFRFE